MLQAKQLEEKLVREGDRLHIIRILDSRAHWINHQFDYDVIKVHIGNFSVLIRPHTQEYVKPQWVILSDIEFELIKSNSINDVLDDSRNYFKSMYGSFPMYSSPYLPPNKMALITPDTFKNFNLNVKVNPSIAIDWNEVEKEKALKQLNETFESFYKTFEEEAAKPRKKPFMNIMKNIFKSKERRALEYYGLVEETDTLSARGRQEFVDFLWETKKDLKDAFIKKVVEAYESNVQTSISGN